MMTLMLHNNNCSFSFSGILFGLFHATLLFGYIIHVCILYIYTGQELEAHQELTQVKGVANREQGIQ